MAEERDDLEGLELPQAPDPAASRAYREAARVLRGAAPAARRWCPPRGELVLAAAELGRERAGRRDAHVAACPLCRDDLRDLGALEAEPSPSLVARLRATLRLVVDEAARAVRVIDASLPGAPAPALAPVRGAGADPLAVVAAPFGDGSLEVAWVAAGRGADLRTRATGGAPTEYRVDLGPAPPDPDAPDAEPEVWESRASDPAGAVALAGLEPGRYRLAVYAPSQREPALEVVVDLARVDAKSM